MNAARAQRVGVWDNSDESRDLVGKAVMRECGVWGEKEGEEERAREKEREKEGERGRRRERERDEQNEIKKRREQQSNLGIKFKSSELKVHFFSNSIQSWFSVIFRVVCQ